MRKKKPAENGGEKTENMRAENAADEAASASPSEAEPDTQQPAEENSEPAKNDEKKDAAQKELGELELLKLYLKQNLGELDRVKKEADELKKNLEKAETQTQQYRDKLSSLVAEYDNFRRRTSDEKVSILNEAVAKAVGKLLPALDSLEKAEPYAETNPESFKKGVSMTLNQLRDGFSSLGVEEIQAEGEPFDPDLHNAVMHFEDESHGENVVAEVFQKGYKIGEKVIRHAMVKVAN